MTTVDRIFQLIEESKLTAKEFANKVGVSQGNITDWKTGRAKPSTEALFKISNACNVSIDYLMGKSDFKNIDETISNYKKEQYKRDVSNALARSTALFLKSGADITHIKQIEEILLSNGTKEQQGSKLAKLYKSFSNDKAEFKNAILSVLDYIVYADAERETYNSLMTLKRKLSFNKKDENLSTQFYMCPVYGRISAGQLNWAEECIEGRIPIDPELMNILNPEECFFLRVNGESMNKEISNGSFALIRKQDMVENGEIAVVLVNGDEATLKKFSKQADVVVLEPMSNDPSYSIQIYNKDTEIKVIGKYIGKMEMK